MTREELKALVRTEPSLASTFATIDAEFCSAMTHACALFKRRAELSEQLAAIEAAKKELASMPAEPEAEPAAETEDPPEWDETSEGTLVDEAVESPVSASTADEAKDRISRMRSVEKLQEVIASDPRVTVVEAARKRLEDIS